MLSQKSIPVAKVAGVDKISKDKIEELSLKDDEQNSLLKVIMWVLIVILLAVAAYVGLKSLLKEDMDQTDDTKQEALITNTPKPDVTIEATQGEKETTTTPKISATPIPTTKSKPTNQPQAKANDFGVEEQVIESNVTGDKVVITRYNYFDDQDLFTFNLFVQGGIPQVEATQSGQEIVLEISNLSTDDVVDEKGKDSKDFKATGSLNLEGLDVEYNDNVSVYTFSMSKKADYKLSYVESQGALRLEVEN